MPDSYKRLLQEIRDTYFLLQNETVVFASHHSVALLGYKMDELIGKSILELMAPECREWSLKLHRNRLDGESVPQLYETAILRKDGTRIPVVISAWLTHFRGQLAVAGIATDITERKRAEEASRERETMFATLFEHSPISLWEEDWSVVKSYIDVLRDSGVENFGRYFNEHPDEISRCLSLIKLGKPNYAAGKAMFADSMRTFSDEVRHSMIVDPVRFFPQDTWNNMKEALIEIMEGQTHVDTMIVNRTLEGNYAYNLVKMSVAPGCEKNLQRVFVSAMDINKQKQVEENYRQLLEDINDGYGVIQEGKYVFINRRLGEIFGYDPEHILGTSIQQWMLPEYRMDRMQEYENVMLGKEAPLERYEADILRGDGKRIVVESSIKAIHYQGKPAFSVIFRDVTERKKMEELLRESRERFQALIESTSDWIWEVDAKGTYTYASPKVKELLGYAPEEVIGRTPFDFMSTKDAERVMDEYRIIVDSKRPFARMENINLHKNGRSVVLETSGVPFFDANGQLLGYRGIDREITDRKRSEKRLREAYEMLRLMFECAPYGVIITDSDMNIVQANENMVNLLGFVNKDQLIGKSWLNFVPQHLRKKATRNLSGFLNNKSTIDVEHDILKPDGSKIIVVTSFGVLRGSSSNLLGLIAIVRDVTLEKQLKENGQFYIAETIKASENERKRLARALHDDTIQEIMFATYRLQDVIAGNCGSLPDNASSNLKEIQLILKRIATEVRRFTTTLRPDILDDMGLIPSLEWLSDRLRNENGIETKLKIIGKEKRLTPETELTLFRIAQEAVNNVRKHAHASVVEIKLEFGESKITMSVSDNGRGFQLPNTISHFARQQKLGLIGIDERVRLHNGIYEVKSSSGNGTVIYVEIAV